jgi:hypothetical protein
MWLQARIQAIPLQKRAAHLLDAIYNREVEDIVRQVATIHLRIIISEDFEEFYNQVFIQLIVNFTNYMTTRNKNF